MQDRRTGVRYSPKPSVKGRDGVVQAKREKASAGPGGGCDERRAYSKTNDFLTNWDRLPQEL